MFEIWIANNVLRVELGQGELVETKTVKQLFHQARSILKTPKKIPVIVELNSGVSITDEARAYFERLYETCGLRSISFIAYGLTNSQIQHHIIQTAKHIKNQ